MLRYLLIAGAALATAPAGAEIVRSSTVGFEVGGTVTVAAPLDRAWAVTLAPRLWWDKDHTYSDDPANLTLDERAGGCFCEKLPNKGSVEHMRVVYVQPPQMIRMTGGIGPLQAEGATGTLAIVLSKDGEGTKIALSYVAGGYFRNGADQLAPLVDRVLVRQLAGLKAAIESGATTGAARPGATARPAVKGAAPARPAITPNPLADVGETISGMKTEDGAAPDLRQVKPKPKPAVSPR